MTRRTKWGARVARCAAGAVVACAVAGRAAAQVAVRGETVYTMAGAPITDGVVLVGKSGTIERVGPAGGVAVPRGYRLLRAKVVTPGLIDAHTVVGLAGALNAPFDQDQLEKSNPIQPELRAIDAYNSRELLVGWLRHYGITTIHTGHGPGALMSGQTMIVKTRDVLGPADVLDSTAMVAMTIGPEVGRTFSPKSPESRTKGIAMLRAQFVKAQEYARKRAAATPDKPVPRDLGLEVTAGILEGRTPVLVTAQSARDIESALRLQKEFGFKMVLDGAAESYLLIDQLKAAGVPVIVHPAMARNADVLENATVETPAKLRGAGLAVALQSGYEAYVPKTRVVLFEAGIAAAWGVPKEQALGMITIDAARILGVDRRVGSLEAGKDGDLALFDGDPFEYTSHVCAVVLGGEVVAEGCH
jgi:imidazolonepropionase-like amidohydrolase